MGDNNNDSSKDSAPIEALYLTVQLIAVATNLFLFNKYTTRKFLQNADQTRQPNRVNYADTRHHQDDGRRHEELLELLAKSDNDEAEGKEGAGESTSKKSFKSSNDESSSDKPGESGSGNRGAGLY